MEAFSDEMAWQEYYKWSNGWAHQTYMFDIWLASWQTLRHLLEVKTFVPREPVVIHLPDGAPLPDPVPQFEGINYPVGGKPKE